MSAAVFVVAVLSAAALRLPDLGRRPMHADEAVHADKFGTLLEEGHYAYDSSEFHGPTLYYLTLPSAWLEGARGYQDIDETTLRVVPAVLGVLLVAATLGAKGFLGWPGAALAALLTAISPAMVFYSRYFIHEVPLVFFTFGALLGACWYLQRAGAFPALVTGVSVGLMHATKETAPLALGAMVLALALTLVFERRHGLPPHPIRRTVRRRDALLAVVAAAVVSGVLYSSFLGNPGGLVDSVRSYWIWLGRAGSGSIHSHSWDYYLRLLIYFPAEGTPVWSEGLILVLGVAGAAAGWSRRGVPGTDPKVLRFLSLYTLLLVAAYAAIPYKTPWNLLGFLHGLILLAGVGAVWVVQSFRGPNRPAAGSPDQGYDSTTATVSLTGRTGQVAISVALILGAGHLAWQAWSGSFRFAADPRNPYVYAHTGNDVFEIVGRLEELTRAHPEGSAMPIQIISRENLWPLPWYLRGLSGVRWWNGVSDEAENAPVIVVTPEMEPALVRRLYDVPPPGERELYMSIYERRLELRPRVEVRGYASKALWDEFRRLEVEPPEPPPPVAHP
ncbi:MAG: TIGR03663 family protein [Acidobacteria bacterium]|nr:TIGR03663 family protein [Acidobacteriota bacterium]